MVNEVQSYHVIISQYYLSHIQISRAKFHALNLRVVTGWKQGRSLWYPPNLVPFRAKTMMNYTPFALFLRVGLPSLCERCIPDVSENQPHLVPSPHCLSLWADLVVAPLCASLWASWSSGRSCQTPVVWPDKPADNTGPVCQVGRSGMSGLSGSLVWSGLVWRSGPGVRPSLRPPALADTTGEAFCNICKVTMSS